MPNRLNIVLVSPQIPQNTGNIARTCKVTGSRLHIVKPMGFTVEDSKLKRAGLDYWHELDITYYEDIEGFFAANQGGYYLFTTKSKHCYTDVVYTGDVYLLFGREDRGLPEPLLAAHYDRTVRIPMLDAERSLNLSNSVAIGVYEVHRQWGFQYLNREGVL